MLGGIPLVTSGKKNHRIECNIPPNKRVGCILKLIGSTPKNLDERLVEIGKCEGDKKHF